MIDYRTYVTIKVGHKAVKEYFDIMKVEHYDAILGTPFFSKMGIILDLRSPGNIWMGNEVIPTGKVSFDLSKDTNDNIVQDDGAALNEEWSLEGGPQVGPPKGSPCQDKGKHPQDEDGGKE